MMVVVNGAPAELDDGTRVADVVEDAAPDSARGTAVALNGEVVERSRWSSVALSDGDRIEILHAIGGG
jgi:sulfur carrier protein